MVIRQWPLDHTETTDKCNPTEKNTFTTTWRTHSNTTEETQAEKGTSEPMENISATSKSEILNIITANVSRVNRQYQNMKLLDLQL